MTSVVRVLGPPWIKYNILSYIQKCLDTSKYICYTDIEGHQTQDGGTIPPEVAVTNLKPDIVIIDKRRKSVHIFELTVPGEMRINTAHRLKMEKYRVVNVWKTRCGSSDLPQAIFQCPFLLNKAFRLTSKFIYAL